MPSSTGLVGGSKVHLAVILQMRLIWSVVMMLQSRDGEDLLFVFQRLSKSSQNEGPYPKHPVLAQKTLFTQPAVMAAV